MRRLELTLRHSVAGILAFLVTGFGCADEASDRDPVGSVDSPSNSSSSPTLGPTGSSPTGSAAGPSGPTVSPSQPSQPQSPQSPTSGGSSNPSGAGGALPEPTLPNTGGDGAGGTGPDTTPGAGGNGPSAGGSGAGGNGAGGAGPAGTENPGSPAGSGGMGGGAPDMEEPFTGTCTESEDSGRSVSGSGPHDVVIETNSEDGIRCGTIYRPADLGGDEKYPILVWGEGGCSQDGLSNQAALGEIASWGYFVVADGTPGSANACQGRQNGEAFLDYISWAIAENDKPCSAYYQSLETTKIAADGFSCGGLMAENVAGDPRFTAIGITSSGLMGPNDALWDSMHAPFKIMNGGSSDVAYPNGLNDYEAISSRGIPIVYFAKTSAGHGGDLNQGRGDFNLVNLAWLNWQLKGDEGATGKAFLHGPSCEFCSDPGWEYMSANIE